MNKWGIKAKVLFLALIPASVIAVVLAFHFTSSRIMDLDRSLHDRGLAIARQLAPASEYGVISGNRDILQTLVDAAMREADVSAVYIMDVSGKVLAVSGKPVMMALGNTQGASSDKRVTVGDASAFRIPVYQSEVLVEDMLDDTVSFGKVRQQLAAKVIGEVNVELSLKHNVQRKNKLLMDSLLITLLGLFASSILALRMSKDVTRPIFMLADVVKKIGMGDLDARAPENSGGAVGTLESGVNAMASRLKSAHDHMQEKILEATSLLSFHASHDALTGLINRREFELRLERALETARLQERVHVLCYLDLDQFKIVNDTCGHGAGDELLRQLTVLLQANVRERDTLARLGGDEFGILLENCPMQVAHNVAEVLRRAVEEYRFVWKNKSFVVGASFGLVELNQQSSTVAAALSSADEACYAAKDRGRNCIHVYQLEDSDLLRRHGEMQWVLRIANALEENRFRLYGQIISPLLSRHDEGMHFEVLLRMLAEDGVEVIVPMAFIPAAERYNTMKGIDRWVISNTFAFLCEQNFGKGAHGALDSCSINLSGASLCDEHFLDFILAQFEKYPVAPHNICFEITETAAILNLAAAVELIRALKKTGCRFALDDFGSGLSSFTYLKNLPVDILKIDGTFVKDMANDPIDFAMVQSIHNIGHVMGLKTVAEFVESEAVLGMLKQMGVDYAQGCWIDIPKPIEQIVFHSEKAAHVQ